MPHGTILPPEAILLSVWDLSPAVAITLCCLLKARRVVRSWIGLSQQGCQAEQACTYIRY
jgi:hypothetical protein